MRRGFYLAAVMLLCAASAFAADKKDGDKDEKKPEGEKYINLGQVAGILTSTGGSESDYAIRVTLHVVEPNPQAQLDLIKKNAQLMQRQAQIMNVRNPWQRQQQMVQLMRDAQQAPANLFTVKEVQHDVRASPADDMKVRLAQPPDAFDDKGNIKKYTAKELKELKGPDNLPGFTGTLEDVKANQLVLVTLARKPVKPADKPKNGDKPKDGEKAKDDNKLFDKDNPLLIRMIVVLGEKK
jgi:hypothetical protein